MSELLTIDPSKVWVRQIKRGEGASAKTIGRGLFARPLNAGGEPGGIPTWANSQISLQLDDDDTFTLELPNGAGEDGVLHKDRFDLLTSDSYEPGEEYLEFWRDPNELIGVGTPTGGGITPKAIVIKGSSLGVVLAGSLSSEVDQWDAAAPADALHHYSRAVVLAYGENVAVKIKGAKAAYGTAWKSPVFTGVDVNCWTVDVKCRWLTQEHEPFEALELLIPGWGNVGLRAFDGLCNLTTGTPYVRGRQLKTKAPADLSMRVVCRYDHLYFFIAGELVLELRRQEASRPVIKQLEVRCSGEGAEVAIDEAKVETLVNFAGDGSQIDRRLPGIPPATGLRAQYWSVASAMMNSLKGTMAEIGARLWPLSELETPAAIDKVEPTLNVGSPTKPAGIAGPYVVRWSGAVYLPLSEHDRKIRLYEPRGNSRIYVGRCLRGEEAASNWGGELIIAGGETMETPLLRSWLGTEEDGWYPIVIEMLVAETAVEPEALIVELMENVEGGTAVIPESRLSPIGTYSDVVRLTSHRQQWASIAAAFGYQWRTEPQSFESGKSPGELSARVLAGRQSDVIIDDKVFATEAQSQIDATDVADGLVADAAGLSKAEGASLSAQEVDYERAAVHSVFRQGYESLSDITEEKMLRVRLETLLGLRGSPNEQVGVRPVAQRDLTDTFPLTGALAKMAWRPGDGVRLDLDRINVHDSSTRQLKTVTWPLKPDGSGRPEVGFRQRPRSLKALVRRLQNTIYAPRRTYQGQLATITGSLGAADHTGALPEGSGAVDRYSRVILPANVSIVRATLTVLVLTGGEWKVQLVGVEEAEQVKIKVIGRYDVTNWLHPVGDGDPHTYATLTGGAAGYFVICLSVLVRV